MQFSTPSRYAPTNRSLAEKVKEIRRSVHEYYLRRATGLWEAWLFCWFGGTLLRKPVSLLNRAKLHALQPMFDADFYLKQFDNELRRRRVCQAPLLHYSLFGWRESRSPAPAFDPVFYRQANPSLQSSEDPALHYVANSAAALVPRNAVDRQADKLAWQPGRETVLTIHHARGGGSSRFLDLFEQELWRKGNNILRLRAVSNAPSLAVVEDRSCVTDSDLPTQVFDLSIDLPNLAKFARQRGVRRLLVNHLVDRPSQMMDWIKTLAADLDCPYDAILHDYFALCPRVDMVDGQGKFCGMAPPAVCAQCIAAHGSEVADMDPLKWREAFSAFLEGAAAVFVPSHDTAARVGPRLAVLPTIWTPESESCFIAEGKPALAPDEPLRVAVLGALNISKGLRVVAGAAREAKLARAPITFTVLGPASDPSALAREGVEVVGPYREEEADDLIDRADPHVVFLPAIWPETWSFVLTTALRRGLPVVAFDLGAPAERLRRLGRGQLLPPDLAEKPAAVLAAFMRLRGQWIS